MDNILHFIPTLSKIATKINGNLINWRLFMKWWPSAVQTPKECNRAVREIFTCSPSKKNQHIRSLVSVDLPETWWVQCWRKTWTFNPGNYITYRSYLWRTATGAWNTEKLCVHDMKTGRSVSWWGNFPCHLVSWINRTAIIEQITTATQKRLEKIHHQSNVIMWCNIIWDHVIGPVLLQNTMNSNYLNMCSQ